MGDSSRTQIGKQLLVVASYSEVGLEKSERLLKKDFLLVGVNEALVGKGKIFFFIFPVRLPQIDRGMYEFDQIFNVLAWPLSKYKQINVKIIRDDGGMDTPTTTRATNKC